MRLIFPAITILFLAACASEVPNSAQPRGVGFGDYTSYAEQSAQREAMLQGEFLPDQPPMTPVETASTSTATATITSGPITTNNPGISDEQNFDAVSGRESIESDAARLERQRAARLVVAPGALPTRPSNSGPNIVAYALSTTNAVGQQVHRRSPVNAEARFRRACSQYSSADQAQEAFLELGGPGNDRKGMDPDGDGFACSWDPSPFRAARS